MAIVEMDSEDLTLILNTIEILEKTLGDLIEGNLDLESMHDFTGEFRYIQRLIQGAIERSERK